MKAWAKKGGDGAAGAPVLRTNWLFAELMDAIDAVASSMARSYSAKTVEPFWVPEL